MISYEYPLNERVRTWLRIEDLFAKADYFMARGGARDHHAALQALFELAEVTTRPDLKSELLQEVDRQRLSLEPLRANPAVDTGLLDAVLGDLIRLKEALFAMPGKPCQSIRENEWLTTIRNRTFIPGATCSFDIPGFHYWLQADPQVRHEDLSAWLAGIGVLRKAVEQVLRLLRDGRQQVSAVAEKGMHQISVGGRTPMLLTLKANEELPCVPEISAGKHIINLRFVTIDKQHRPRLCERDVAFKLLL